MLKEFVDIFPNELPKGLPLKRGIEYAIDLQSGAISPSRATYHMNTKVGKELKRRVDDLIEQGYVWESISPCVVPALLVLKKDITWKMYIDNRAINKIIIKYRYSIW